ncbi:gamma-glutamylcyclotransferase [Limibaculum sp. FT325]|uniref:gamma-glutamylcyclotransferase n=1 Tax=Thermohalobaculum sediminis TaxID=2939436 RepID=UPI0020BE232C|nr:gamma-glutamylcyclotransferase [Limibaculum sediminis]MCL5777816.1 gamma-glutamylcyclotransferase [Limibaculum sediminis]
MSDGGFWVFGYGSLMWRPGFEYLERRMARLQGYRRAFALRSVRYRGTPEAPGLVLGLDWDPNAACTGMAFRICPTRAEAVRTYLAERELVTRSYFEVLHPVALEGGETVDAICYILDRTHPQYCGGLGLDEQARIIACAAGPAGTNRDYLHNTVAHLRELGVEDGALAELDLRVRTLAGDAPSPSAAR